MDCYQDKEINRLLARVAELERCRDDLGAMVRQMSSWMHDARRRPPWTVEKIIDFLIACDVSPKITRDDVAALRGGKEGA